MHIFGFTYLSGGNLTRVFLSPLPDGVNSNSNCVLYNSSHSIVEEGNVPPPASNCNFGAEPIPDGQYTIEILGQLGDLNNPVGVSDTFYMIDGVPSTQPPTSPTPTPDNLAPQIGDPFPRYVVLNTGNTYYLQNSFSDSDSTSWTATVDYGDGSGQQSLALSGKSFVLQHQYATDGTFVITVSITDEQGNTGTGTEYVSTVPIPTPASTLTINNINYVYTSPNSTTLTISFTPDTSFSTFGCDLLVNGGDSIAAFSRTANSCSFHPSFGFDYTNLSLLLYADRQRTQTQRTNSIFYTTTQVLSVTGVQFNQNALVVNTNISKINEACALLDQHNNIVAQTNFLTGNVNSCVFIGYGTNGPHQVPNGTYKLNLPNAGLTSDPFTIINPIPPQIAPLTGATITKGDTYSENGSFTDSDSTSWTATVDYGEGAGAQSLTLNPDNTFSLSHQYANTGTYTVTVNITDNQGNTGTAATQVTVNSNAIAPVVGQITSNPSQVKVNTSTGFSANFTDANTADTHTASWDWGDGHTSSGTVTESNGSGSVSDSHTYTALGSYTVALTVTDSTGLSSTSQSVIAIIPASGLAGSNLSHTNYNGADLSGQNLSKANLSVATFNNVDFQSANLSQVNGSNSSFTNDDFTGANLNKINFSNSNLTGSNFTSAILTQANLSNSNLTNVNFTGANLQGANLSGTIRTGIIWSNATCPNGQNSNNHNNSCAGQGGGL